MRKLTITYDNRPLEKWFHIIEETEHGGTHEYRCGFVTARDTIVEFCNASWAQRMLGPLMDGRLTRITLEA
jgi:hypothetical protein